jgi:hypothetical protein
VKNLSFSTSFLKPLKVISKLFRNLQINIKKSEISQATIWRLNFFILCHRFTKNTVVLTTLCHPIVPYKAYLHYTPRTLQCVNLSKHPNLTNPFHLIYYFPLNIPTGKLPNTGKQLISTKTKDNKIFYLTLNTQLEKYDATVQSPLELTSIN